MREKNNGGKVRIEKREFQRKTDVVQLENRKREEEQRKSKRGSREKSE